MNRPKILQILKNLISGCLNLIGDLNINSEYTDNDLREIQRDINRAKLAVDNSLHTYKNRKE